MPDTPDSLDKSLVRGPDPHAAQSEEKLRRGATGDVRPEHQDPDPGTRGGQPQEDVEDRPGVGTVTPEDYPEQDRADSRTDR